MAKEIDEQDYRKAIRKGNAKRQKTVIPVKPKAEKKEINPLTELVKAISASTQSHNKTATTNTDALRVIASILAEAKTEKQRPITVNVDNPPTEQVAPITGWKMKLHREQYGNQNITDITMTAVR